VIEKFKMIIFKVWPVISWFIPQINFIKRLNKSIYMGDLYRKDPVKWRNAKAAEMGVKIGKKCKFYSLEFYSEPYLIEIGDNVIVSGDVKFLTHDGSFYLFKKRDAGCVYGKIKIGDNCFIGMNAIICPNTQIGNNCIIGAGTVVRGDIPDNSVVMGNPCKVIYKTTMIKRLLLSSQGWVKHQWGDEELRKKLILEHFASVKARPFRKQGLKKVSK